MIEGGVRACLEPGGGTSAAGLRFGSGTRAMGKGVRAEGWGVSRGRVPTGGRGSLTRGGVSGGGGGCPATGELRAGAGGARRCLACASGEDPGPAWCRVLGARSSGRLLGAGARTPAGNYRSGRGVLARGTSRAYRKVSAPLLRALRGAAWARLHPRRALGDVCGVGAPRAHGCLRRTWSAVRAVHVQERSGQSPGGVTGTEGGDRASASRARMVERITARRIAT